MILVLYNTKPPGNMALEDVLEVFIISKLRNSTLMILNSLPLDAEIFEDQRFDFVDLSHHYSLQGKSGLT